MKLLKVILTLLVSMVLLNACKKEYSIESNGERLPVGNWEFKDSAKQYIGTMDTAYISGTGASKQLHLLGISADGSKVFNLTLYADTFKTGFYKASLSQIVFNYSASGKLIYQASQLNGEFTVNIASINASLITGSFSGVAKDSANTFKNLFGGKFKATFATVPVKPTSIGILGDSSGNCKPVVLSGEYKQGITATAANTVQVQVTVAAAGTYSITTNSVNGITFSKTGTFTSTGVQSITLNASGTPAFPGEQTFTLRYGNSQCAFKITFLAGAAPSNDYYPLTTNSNWTYSDGTRAFTYKVLPDTKAIGGNTYSVLGSYTVPPTASYDTAAYIRKSAGNYYSYINYSDYFSFDQPAYGEIIILKDNVPQGTSWQSPTVTGTISGVSVSVYFKMTILEKAIPVTVGSFPFPDVIKVKMETYINSIPSVISEMWYAKNVGLIHISQTGAGTIEVTDYRIF
ncbi:MAG: hypothetical protein ABIR03_03950 [Ginsengibacter sp.]